MWPLVLFCFFPTFAFQKILLLQFKGEVIICECMRTTNNKKKYPSVCFRSWIEITFTVKFNVFVTHTNFASAAAVSAANFQLSREWMPQQYNIQLTNLYSFTLPLFSIIDCLCSAITERVLTKKKNAILNAIEKWQNTRETFTGAEERFGFFL